MTKERDKEKEKGEEKSKSGIKKVISDITALIGSRLVFGGLLVFLGIRIAIDPNSAPKKIAWGIGFAILIATGGLFIGFITTKSINRANLVPILETIAFTILGICMMFFPQPFGSVLEEILLSAVIVNCVSNLLCLKDFNRLQAKLDAHEEAIRKKQSEDMVIREVSTALKEDFEKYNGELINASKKIKKKTDASTWGQIILNIAMIAFALIMLLIRTRESSPVYLLSGIVMVLSGCNEMVLAIRGWKEKKRGEKLAEG